MLPLLPTLGQVRLSELHDALCTAEIWELACLLDFWLCVCVRCAVAVSGLSQRCAAYSRSCKHAVGAE